MLTLAELKNWRGNAQDQISTLLLLPKSFPHFVLPPSLSHGAPPGRLACFSVD